MNKYYIIEVRTAGGNVPVRRLVLGYVHNEDVAKKLCDVLNDESRARQVPSVYHVATDASETPLCLFNQ